ncbi:hypothetical protein OQA88_92 [Cercophora sp. LCS_1]
MAPVATLTTQYLREQIIENCEFQNVPHARLYLIVAKEALGNFKAIVAKAENGRREALLSECGGTIHEALQLLLTRSAEAVQHHITAHGFDFVPEKDELDDEDDVSDSEFSARIRDDSADESLSDNETVSIASTARVPNVSRSSRKRPSSSKQSSKNKANTRRPRSRSRSPTSTSRSSSASSVRVANPPPPPHPLNFPHPGYGMQLRPPHMHPAGPWRNSEPNPNSNPPRPPFVIGTRPPPPPGPFPGSHQPPKPPVLQKVPPPVAGPMPPVIPKRDIRMLIRLRGASTAEQRVLESVPLTVRSISEAAKTYVRRNQAKFLNPNTPWQLRAVVRRVKMSDTDYDVSGYSGDDLRPLVDAVSKAGVMPEVEVEVHSTEVVPPPPAPSGGRFYGEGFVMPGVEFRG